MKILVEFELSEDYAAWYSNDENRIKAILAKPLDGVEFEIIKRCPECENPYLHIPDNGLFWCDECGYTKSNN